MQRIRSVSCGLGSQKSLKGICSSTAARKTPRKKKQTPQKKTSRQNEKQTITKVIDKLKKFPPPLDIDSTHPRVRARRGNVSRYAKLKFTLPERLRERGAAIRIRGRGTGNGRKCLCFALVSAYVRYTAASVCSARFLCRIHSPLAVARARARLLSVIASDC